MPRLADHAELQKEGRPTKVGEILDKELTIIDVAFKEGRHGEYAIFTVVDADGVTFSVQTTGFLIIDALKHADQEDAFPLDALFKRTDRTYTVE